MPERIELNNADQARPGTLSYRPVRIDKHLDTGQVGVEFVGVNGERREEIIDDMGFLRQLIAPNRPKSEARMVMEKLIALGRFAGTISGSPD